MLAMMERSEVIHLRSASGVYMRFLGGDAKRSLAEGKPISVYLDIHRIGESGYAAAALRHEFVIRTCDACEQDDCACERATQTWYVERAILNIKVDPHEPGASFVQLPTRLRRAGAARSTLFLMVATAAFRVQSKRWLGHQRRVSVPCVKSR